MGEKRKDIFHEALFDKKLADEEWDLIYAKFQRGEVSREVLIYSMGRCQRADKRILEIQHQEAQLRIKKLEDQDLLERLENGIILKEEMDKDHPSHPKILDYLKTLKKDKRQKFLLSRNLKNLTNEDRELLEGLRDI